MPENAALQGALNALDPAPPMTPARKKELFDALRALIKINTTAPAPNPGSEQFAQAVIDRKSLLFAAPVPPWAGLTRGTLLDGGPPTLINLQQLAAEKLILFALQMEGLDPAHLVPIIDQAEINVRSLFATAPHFGTLGRDTGLKITGSTPADALLTDAAIMNIKEAAQAAKLKLVSDKINPFVADITRAKAAFDAAQGAVDAALGAGTAHETAHKANLKIMADQLALMKTKGVELDAYMAGAEVTDVTTNHQHYTAGGAATLNALPLPARASVTAANLVATPRGPGIQQREGLVAVLTALQARTSHAVAALPDPLNEAEAQLKTREADLETMNQVIAIIGHGPTPLTDAQKKAHTDPVELNILTLKIQLYAAKVTKAQGELTALETALNAAATIAEKKEKLAEAQHLLDELLTLTETMDALPIPAAGLAAINGIKTPAKTAFETTIRNKVIELRVNLYKASMDEAIVVLQGINAGITALTPDKQEEKRKEALQIFSTLGSEKDACAKHWKPSITGATKTTYDAQTARYNEAYDALKAIRQHFKADVLMEGKRMSGWLEHFEDSIVSKSEPLPIAGTPPPTGPRVTTTGEVPIVTFAEHLSDQEILRTVATLEDGRKGVLDLEVLKGNDDMKKIQLTDKTDYTTPVSEEDAARLAFETAVKIWKNYQEGSGSLEITGKPPEQAMKIHAALLVLRPAQYSDIEIHQNAENATGPEKSFVRQGAANQRFINEQFTEAVLNKVKRAGLAKNIETFHDESVKPSDSDYYVDKRPVP